MNARGLNFSWVIDGKLAGCAGPVLETDLAFLAAKGIRALVTLAQEQEGVCGMEEIARAGLEDYSEPVPDMQAPRQEQLDNVIRFINECLIHGKPVAVSCWAGQGRTGTVLTCYLVSEGLSAEDAIAEMRRKGRTPYEASAIGQLQAVQEYARRQKITGSE